MSSDEKEKRKKDNGKRQTVERDNQEMQIICSLTKRCI
jgi:hypothetical protein